MTRNTRRFDDFMGRAFAPFRNVDREHVTAACDRVLRDLRGGSVDLSMQLDAEPTSARGTRWIRPVVACAAAAGLVIGAFWLQTVRTPEPTAPTIASVEADGGLFRVATSERLRSGDSIHVGDLVRANGAAGAVLRLDDESRVEMRTQAELSMERAGDGVRIHLHSGGIIVNAAKQRSGHLYVQTKDLTVSVVGTVFL